MKRQLGFLAAIALAIPFGTPAFASGGQILINGDAGFATCGCVSSGDGSPAHPFVIGPLAATADSNPGILVENTTKAFVLLHADVHVTGAADGIVFQNVTGPALISHVNIASPPSGGGGGGIHFIGASGVTIDGDNINSLHGWGIKIEGGSSNEVRFMNVNHSGLANPASKDTATLPPSQNPFLMGMTGSAVGGVLLLNTTGNFVHDDLLNEDAYANLQLVHADGNHIQKIVARYPDYFGTSLENSSHNLLEDLSLEAADFDGLIIRGGGFNTVRTSTFSANGPIGNEWAAGVVPYFIAGVYFGWGTHDNVVTQNNANFGTTGPNIVMDDGSVPTPSSSTQGGVVQNHNPLNTATGSDPGGGTVVGPGNKVCGNDFSVGSWWPSGLNPNQAC